MTARRRFRLVPTVAVMAGLLMGVSPGIVPVSHAVAVDAPFTPDPAAFWTISRSGCPRPFDVNRHLDTPCLAHPTHPIVGLAVTHSRLGLWAVASDGGVFAFGDAPFLGSTGSMRLNQPIVGIAATPSNQGYWLVASDGGVFAFGDAQFLGSTGSMRLNQPILGMAATPSGHGYWLVASDGGVFAFGDAQFFGAGVGLHLPGIVTNLAPTATGLGYWIASTGGGVATFGDAPFLGTRSLGATDARIAGLVPSASGLGYLLYDFGGDVFPYGDAPSFVPPTEPRMTIAGLATGTASASAGGAFELLGESVAMGGATVVKPTGNTVALTFDDGPNPSWTPQVLDILDRYHVKAVFFVVGTEARKYPDLVREILSRGHVLANHSWSHPQLPKLGDAAVRAELRDTSDLIEVTTAHRPVCMRPPYGATDARVLADVHAVGLQQILWNVNPEDYTKPGASVIASRVVAGARPGAILPLHDGGGNRSQTVAALPAIINGVRAKGLDFTLICE